MGAGSVLLVAEWNAGDTRNRQPLLTSTSSLSLQQSALEVPDQCLVARQETIPINRQTDASDNDAFPMNCKAIFVLTAIARS